MKQIVTILLFVPVLAFSQSKKKKRQAEEKANAEMVAKLTAHIRFLADDKLEGRRTGSKGEWMCTMSKRSAASMARS